MRDAVFQELIRADAEALPLIKAGGVALGFDEYPLRVQLLPDLADTLSQEEAAEALSPLHSEHTAHLHAPFILAEGPQVGQHTALLLVKNVERTLIQAVDILIGALLLHHEDGAAGLQNLIELARGQLFKCDGMQGHGAPSFSGISCGFDSILAEMKHT